MSIRSGLLALLQESPRYGFQLRADFESRTGATWPLNIGQVYTTLARLERDGLVESAGVDSDGRALYAITEAGRNEVTAWFDTPVDRSTPTRDELAIKLAVAVPVPGIDVQRIVQRQRSATMQALQAYTRLKSRGDAQSPATESPQADSDLAWLLVVESLIFAAEAEVRWLDHVEARVARAALRGRAAPAPVPNPANSTDTTTETAAHR